MEKIKLEDLLKLDITNKVICFPTDTVYGVGCKIDDLDSIKRIFEMKKRDGKKPLAILCTNKSQIEKYVKINDEKTITLMDKYWPGALTIIFEKTNLIDDEITCGKNTVAFRSPDSEISQRILETFGLMPTTSVNFSGMKELNSVDEIEEAFSDYIDYIVTDNQPLSKTPSTIYDSISSKVVRVGKIIIS